MKFWGDQAGAKLQRVGVIGRSAKIETSTVEIVTSNLISISTKQFLLFEMQAK